MSAIGIRCGFGLLICSLIVSNAESPQIITEPNAYSFSPSIYYADSTDTNAAIEVILYPGDPSMHGAVGYFSQDGTAVAGRDYTAVSGIAGPSVIPAIFNVPLHPSYSPTNKTVNLFLTNLTQSAGMRIGHALLIIRAAPLALALPHPLVPATFNFSACRQGEKLDVISTATHQTRTTTNTIQITKSTLDYTNLGTQQMLALLQNSFGTNFPAGAQIAFSVDHIYVVDSSGTNIILDPVAVASLTCDEQFISGLETQMNNQDNTVLPSSGNSTEAITAHATLSYDDSGMATSDGTSTKFEFGGVYVIKFSTNLKNLFSRVSIDFQGSGDGIIRSQTNIIAGRITGNAAGSSGP